MTILPVPLWAAFLLALIICLPGCSTRYLTEEEDAAIRDACGDAGCAVIPKPVFFQIMQKCQGV